MYRNLRYVTTLHGRALDLLDLLAFGKAWHGGALQSGKSVLKKVPRAGHLHCIPEIATSKYRDLSSNLSVLCIY